MNKAAFRHIAEAVVGCGLFVCVGAVAQVTVVSEFQRIDPFGKVVRQDKQENPREILSPAVARNATASFQVMVEVPAGKHYYLHVGLNPEEAVNVKVYRELFVIQRDGQWVPDLLMPVELPYLGKIGESGISGQKIDMFWLDVQVPRDAKVERIKVDPQLWVDERWLSYPMEVRVVPAQLDGALPTPGEPAPLNYPVDASAQRVWRRKFCSIDETSGAANALTIRHLVERNARQDVALRSRWTADDVTRVLGIKDAAQLCGEAHVPSPRGPENYLRLRDRILRGE